MITTNQFIIDAMQMMADEADKEDLRQLKLYEKIYGDIYECKP